MLSLLHQVQVTGVSGETNGHFSDEKCEICSDRAIKRTNRNVNTCYCAVIKTLNVFLYISQ